MTKVMTKNKVKIGVKNLMEASYLMAMTDITPHCFANGANVIHTFEIEQASYEKYMANYKKSILPDIYLKMKQLKKSISCEQNKKL